MRAVPSPPPGAWPSSRRPSTTLSPLSERLAATSLAIEQARAATASTFALTRWNAHETSGITRCPHCGLHIVGTATLQLRAAIHARVCPGGDRAAEWWFPRLVRNDVPRPVLRLVYGGKPKLFPFPPPAAQESSMTMARGRVLVIEDDPDGRESLTELLRIDGYDVTTAADGGTALARLRTDEPVNALIVDFILPDIDGIEVIRAAHALTNRPAVIVFTGYHRQKTAAEAAGCDAFILKPDIEQLLTQLSTLIAARVGRVVPPPPDSARKKNA